MGEKSEGFKGTIIKETWRIRKGLESGEVGGECWGGVEGKAEYCT